MSASQRERAIQRPASKGAKRQAARIVPSLDAQHSGLSGSTDNWKRILREVWPVAAIVAAGAVLRLCLWLIYTEMVCGDTSSWLHPAMCLANGHLERITGFRPPAYPLFCFLATFGMQQDYAGNIVLLQFFMDIVSAVLVYVIVRQAICNRFCALPAALLSVVCINHAILDMTILSETFASFWVVTTFFFATQCARLKAPTILPWLALGISAAVCALARPNNLIFIPFLATWLFWIHRDSFSTRQRVAYFSTFVAASCAPVLSWCLLLFIHLGYFGISTGTGFNLTHKVIDFVHLAPPSDEPIRGVLIKWEVPHNPQQVPLDSRIWFAYDELDKLPILHETGPMRFVELSRKLAKMDVELIEAHPMLYARAVFASFARSWFPRRFEPVSLSDVVDPMSLTGGNVVLSPEGQNALAAMAWVEDVVIAVVYAGLLVLLVPAFFAWLAPPLHSGFYIPVIAWVLFLATLSSSLIEYGNGRFPIPYQPLGIAGFAIALWEIASRMTRRDA